MDFQSLFYKLFSLLSEDWKLILILSIVFALYYYNTATFDFFKKKGIPYMKPVIFLGNMGPRLKGTRSFHEFQMDIYNYFKGKRFGGMFEGRQPILYILDLDLIKSITIRDFDHFVDRNHSFTKKPTYLKKTLLGLKGPEWKGVRSRMTPVFSTSRVKNMLPLLELCSLQMVEYLKQYDQQEVELKAAMGRYTLEVIGACAFGIKCEALSKRDCHFIKIAKKLDYVSTCKRLAFLMLMFMPQSMIRRLNFASVDMESSDGLMRILQTTKAERRLINSEKKDFLQLLVDVAKKEQTETDNKIKYMDDDIIDAQCLFFLIAGYETSSTLLSFAIHVLATKPELQDKLRAHILEVTQGKELTYELIAELEYLEGILLETLRLYPPVGRVNRVVTKPYTLPDSKVKLDVGDMVAIPIYAFHMDPEYYPDPLEFRPERFMGEEKKNRPSHMFLAFGTGPRNCIGSRFAMVTAKIAMVMLMKNFKFTTCPKTANPVSFHKRTGLLNSKSGLWVRVEKL